MKLGLILPFSPNLSLPGNYSPSVGFPNPNASKVLVQCHVAPKSVVVLMYHVPGSEEGTAQTLGMPLGFGLTLLDTLLSGGPTVYLLT